MIPCLIILFGLVALLGLFKLTACIFAARDEAYNSGYDGGYTDGYLAGQKSERQITQAQKRWLDHRFDLESDTEHQLRIGGRN